MQVMYKRGRVRAGERAGERSRGAHESGVRHHLQHRHLLQTRRLEAVGGRLAPRHRWLAGLLAQVPVADGAVGGGGQQSHGGRTDAAQRRHVRRVRVPRRARHAGLQLLDVVHLKAIFRFIKLNVSKDSTGGYVIWDGVQGCVMGRSGVIFAVLR